MEKSTRVFKAKCLELRPMLTKTSKISDLIRDFEHSIVENVHQRTNFVSTRIFWEMNAVLSLKMSQTDHNAVKKSKQILKFLIVQYNFRESFEVITPKNSGTAQQQLNSLSSTFSREKCNCLIEICFNLTQK